MRAASDGLAAVAMRTVGHAASQLRAAHVDWSPHVEGDAAVISEDGSMQLFGVASAAGGVRARATQLRGTYCTSKCARVGRLLNACAQSRCAGLYR